MSAPSPASTAEPALLEGAVLVLSPERAEWCEVDAQGGVRLGSAAVAAPGPTALAQACAEARAAAGSQTRACTLALAGAWVGQRLLQLPVLGRRETAGVLERKAAALLGCAPGDVCYSARQMPQQRSGSADASQETNWLLACCRRAQTVELRIELRKRGFGIKRVVPAELAIFDLARAHVAEPEQALLAIHFAPEAVTLALCHGQELIHHDRLEGDFLAAPALAATLLQALRTTSGYWRKLSRGESLDQILLIGLPPARGQLLRQAVEASLPGSRVTVLPGASGSSEQARAFALCGPLYSGPFALSLAARLPLRQRWTIAAVAASVLAVSGFGLIERAASAERLAEVRALAERLAERTRDLEQHAQHNSAVAARVNQVATRLEQLLELGSLGVDAQALLGEALHALQGQAALKSFDLREAEGQAAGTLALRAWCEHDPAGAALAMASARAQLARSAWLAGGSLDLPTRVGGDGQSARAPLLEFGFEAALRGAP